MKLNAKLLTISILAILIGFIPLRSTTSATSLGTAISPFGLDPTIDGTLDTAEWINSSIYYYPMYKITDQLDTMDLYFRTTYSTTNLTFGITIYDNNTVGSELIVVIFKVNTTGDLVVINGGNPYIENGNDAKVLYLDDTPADCYTMYSDFNAYFDSNNPGGSTDVYGEAVTTTDVKVDFEITMVLDSGDIPESRDIALEASDTIEIFFWYLDDSGYYSGYRDTDLDYDNYILELYVPPDPVTITLPPVTVTPPPETITEPETTTQNQTITITTEAGLILSSVIITAVLGVTFVVLILRKRKK